MSLSRVTRFRFFILAHLSPKLTMLLRVTTVFLCLMLLMTYSGLTLPNKCFARRTLLIRSLFLLALRVNKDSTSESFRLQAKVQVSDFSVATQIFDEDYYLFKIDLKSGYFHTEMFPEQPKYFEFALGFRQWEVQILSTLRSSVWPFFCSFHLLLPRFSNRPAQISWRSWGIPIAIFLDNGLGGGIQYTSC